MPRCGCLQGWARIGCIEMTMARCHMTHQRSLEWSHFLRMTWKCSWFMSSFTESTADVVYYPHTRCFGRSSNIINIFGSWLPVTYGWCWCQDLLHRPIFDAASHVGRGSTWCGHLAGTCAKRRSWHCGWQDPIVATILCDGCVKLILAVPIGSMYGIFTYIGIILS